MIHRNMKRFHKELATDLGIKVDSCISITQLRRILEEFDFECFNKITDEYFDTHIECEELN